MQLPAFTALALAACQNDDPLSSNESPNANEDAAESIASAIGADNGGATDQLGDIIELAGASGMQKPLAVLLGKYRKPNTIAGVDTSYGNVSTWLVLQRDHD